MDCVTKKWRLKEVNERRHNAPPQIIGTGEERYFSAIFMASPVKLLQNRRLLFDWRLLISEAHLVSPRKKYFNFTTFPTFSILLLNNWNGVCSRILSWTFRFFCRSDGWYCSDYLSDPTTTSAFDNFYESASITFKFKQSL